MRILQNVALIVLFSTRLCAQTGMNEAEHPLFPETAALRERIAALDSSRSAIAAAAVAGDSLLALADSLHALERVWDAVPTMRTWRGRFPETTDSILAAWLADATMLFDSARALHILDVQRSAVHVDSVRGVIDLVPLPAQRIYRVRAPDSSARMVQLDKPRKTGDTVVAYVTLFGRKMYISRTSPLGWEMVEGLTPPVGADSVFDVYREVGRPRAYESYDRFVARFVDLRLRMTPAVTATFAALIDGMRHDVALLRSRTVALERESAASKRDLWRREMMLTARALEQRDQRVAAVGVLEQLLAVDSSFPGAADTLLRIRHHIDSSTHATYLGADGRANMELIPGGAIALRSGERFRPDVFFIDHAPISAQLFALFEAATGYRARGKWRDRILEADSMAVEPVQGLAAEDKVAFAQWAGKRVASPQEVEYVHAGGFASLTQRMQHAGIDNPYHVREQPDGFYCVRDLRGLDDSERAYVESQASDRAKEIQSIVEGVH